MNALKVVQIPRGMVPVERVVIAVEPGKGVEHQWFRWGNHATLIHSGVLEDEEELCRATCRKICVTTNLSEGEPTACITVEPARARAFTKVYHVDDIVSIPEFPFVVVLTTINAEGITLERWVQAPREE